MTEIHISKLDAATRQLQMAVRLFMNNGDPISIHTLACASRGILEALAKREGIRSQRIQILERIKPEFRKKISDRLCRARNFFKHADRDAGDVLTFNQHQNDFEIWDATQIYRSLTKEDLPLFVVFDLWMRASHPDMYIFTEEQKKGHAILFKDLDPSNREHFFSSLLSIAEEAFRNKVSL